jgi:plastocyanin
MLANTGCRIALVLACALACGQPALAQQTHTVTITDFKFIPEVVRVRVGDTIVFVNKDIVPHTATAKDGAWDSGDIAAGAKKSHAVTRAGRDAYFCRYHPSMLGVVEVKP